jgi:hypothetical protein
VELPDASRHQSRFGYTQLISTLSEPARPDASSEHSVLFRPATVRLIDAGPVRVRSALLLSFPLRPATVRLVNAGPVRVRSVLRLSLSLRPATIRLVDAGPVRVRSVSLN